MSATNHEICSHDVLAKFPRLRPSVSSWDSDHADPTANQDHHSNSTLKVDDDDEGCRTPTSEEHKIPVMKECPPAPHCPRSRSRKRKLLSGQFNSGQLQVDVFRSVGTSSSRRQSPDGRSYDIESVIDGDDDQTSTTTTTSLMVNSVKRMINSVKRIRRH